MVIVIIFFSIVVYLNSSHFQMQKCKYKAEKNPDVYCEYYYTGGNRSSDPQYRNLRMGSHQQDALKEKQRQENLEDKRQALKEEQECYDAGTDIEREYSLFDYYNLTCPQMEYINDHLIQEWEKRDGGHVKTERNGFFTSSSTETQLYQWVELELLATGKLLASESYHLDCNDQESERKETYYDVSDFVMMYVRECVHE